MKSHFPPNSDEFIESHDRRATTPLSEDEQVETWLAVIRNPSVPERSREKARERLAKLGYRVRADWELELIEP